MSRARQAYLVGIIALLIIALTQIGSTYSSDQKKSLVTTATPFEPAARPHRWLDKSVSRTTIVYADTRAGSRRRPEPVPAPPPPDLHTLKLCIQQHESGGSYTAKNPHSTASGISQWLDSTWNNWGGFARAKDAPADIQDARMDRDMAQGLGYIRSTWAAQRRNCHF